jgi:hypothetical protein
VISEKAANILLKTEAYGEDWPALFSRFVGFWNQLAEAYEYKLRENISFLTKKGDERLFLLSQELLYSLTESDTLLVRTMLNMFKVNAFASVCEDFAPAPLRGRGVSTQIVSTPSAGEVSLFIPLHMSLLALLDAIKFDVPLIIDWLVSSETPLLEYLLLNLKYLSADKHYSKVLSLARKVGLLETFTATLQALYKSCRSFNEKNLFPYKADVLVEHLKVVVLRGPIY